VREHKIKRKKMAQILYEKIPSHEEWMHICTLVLDIVMGQLHTFCTAYRQKELLVLNE
jgi:hypothetical protein